MLLPAKVRDARTSISTAGFEKEIGKETDVGHELRVGRRRVNRFREH